MKALLIRGSSQTNCVPTKASFPLVLLQSTCTRGRRNDFHSIPYSYNMTKNIKRHYTSHAISGLHNERSQPRGAQPGQSRTLTIVADADVHTTQTYGSMQNLQRTSSPLPAIRKRIVQNSMSIHQNQKQNLPVSERQTTNQHLKRKADSQPTITKQIQRPRLQEKVPSIDEQYIRKTFSLPNVKQYPTAPHRLFKSDTIVSALHNLGNNALDLHQVFTDTRDGFHCKVSGKLPDESEITAEADGRSKKDAARASHLLILSKLHTSGVLKELFNTTDQLLDSAGLKAERDAKIDIYNYAARFGLIPEVSYKKLVRSARSKLFKKPQIEVTVEIKEQGLRTSAVASSYLAAETSACFNLKQKAEKYHATHGGESIVVKDAEVLTTGNARKFIDFYKLRRNGCKIETVFSTAKDLRLGGGNSNTCQIFLADEGLGPAVSMTNKKSAEDLSHLVAAITLTQRDPELFKQFRSALSASGEILLPIRSVDLELDSDGIIIMKDTLRDVERAGLRSEIEELISDEQETKTRHVKERRRLDETQKARRNELLSTRQEIFNGDPDLQALRDKKNSLPMSQNRRKVLEHIEGNAYSVIIGATGSGKTTQVPQILLEDAISKGRGADCDIICTQPRRIAATSVARRVAEERNESLQESVGYQVRFDAKVPRPGGSITYCTTGILLQQLQHSPDQMLDGISHIIVDEVHERDINIDFLLITIKKTIQSRRALGKPTPKVVLMSATIDSELFSKYFEETTPDGELLPCPTISIPGRTFPVAEKHLETIMKEIEGTYGTRALSILNEDDDTRDFLAAEMTFKAPRDSPAETSQGEVVEATIDWRRELTITADGQMSNEKEDAMVPVALIATTIAHIAKTTDEGAILVFHPGYDEIKKVMEKLQRQSLLGVDFKDKNKFKISILHSSIPANEQAEVFETVPAGCRKIILSTNIAETSVTIPDVQYVVDSGKMREKRYDQIRRITKLQCTWISKSNVKQRAGRAGRVQNGNYYALYSTERAKSLRAIGLPEILRSDLQEVCLDIKAQAFQMPIREFLSDTIEPPAPAAVDASVLNLQALQALTEDESLTALGRILASLPVHPSLGKMILLGIIFRCLDPMIILGAALNERSLFVSPPDRRREAQSKHALFLEGNSSDHIALLNAFWAMREQRDRGGRRNMQAMTEFAFAHFLHVGAFKTIEQTGRQIEDVLIDSGLVPVPSRHGRASGDFGDVSLNQNSHKVGLVKALTLAGVYPNLGVCKGYTLRTPGENLAMIHPGSLNYVRKNSNTKRQAEDSDSLIPGSIYAYGTLSSSQDGRPLLKDTTLCTPLQAFLFGGKIVWDGSGVVHMDGWLPFYVRVSGDSPVSGNKFLERKTLVQFRETLDRVLSNAFRDLAQLKKDNGRAMSGRSLGQHADKGRGGYENEIGSKHNNVKKYLADDDLRSLFASSLVEVLDRDICFNSSPIKS